jgi:hypothetical protein
MRITVALDDDVAAMIGSLRVRRRCGLKQLINDALRQGLGEIASPVPPVPRASYLTPSHSAGRRLLPSLDNVAEVLAIVEREDYP